MQNIVSLAANGNAILREKRGLCKAACSQINSDFQVVTPTVLLLSCYVSNCLWTSGLVFI